MNGWMNVNDKREMKKKIYLESKKIALGIKNIIGKESIVGRKVMK